MIRVLLRRRTILFTLFVVFLVVTFIELSMWQWHRHESRALHNSLVRAAWSAPVVPVSTILPSTSTPLAVPDVWRRVTALGRYDTSRQLLIRYRAHDDDNGFEVLTPLVTDHGTLWVDRGWIPLAGRGADDLPAAPAPPAGDVTVTGYLQSSETTDKTVLPATGQVRTITLPVINSWYGRPAYGAYLQRITESPAPATSPTTLAVEDLSGGPHVAYAIQWALFAAIGVGGYLKLIRDDVLASKRPNEEKTAPGSGRDGRVGTAPGASAGSERPVVETSLDSRRVS